MYIHSSTEGEITVKNSNFYNIYLSPTSPIINLNNMYNADVYGLTFTNITSDQSSDFTNVMIDLNSITSSQALNITISNITVTNSQIPLIQVSTADSTESVEKTFLMSNITITNMFLNNKMDLIYFGKSYNFVPNSFIIDNLNINNVEFLSGGNLIFFRHQIKEYVYITNSEFYNITHGSISVESFNLFDIKDNTKISFLNTSVHDIEGGESSFLQLYAGAVVEIRDCTFKYMSNLNYGPVVNADSESSFTAYNSVFINNTSLDGGVFIAQKFSLIKLFE